MANTPYRKEAWQCVPSLAIHDSLATQQTCDLLRWRTSRLDCLDGHWRTMITPIAPLKNQNVEPYHGCCSACMPAKSESAAITDHRRLLPPTWRFGLAVNNSFVSRSHPEHLPPPVPRRSSAAQFLPDAERTQAMVKSTTAVHLHWHPRYIHR